MLNAVLERAAYPGFKERMVGGYITTVGQPAFEEPVHRPHLILNRSAYFDLGDGHRRKFNHADFAFRFDVLNFEPDIIATVLELDDLRIVPHVAKPLSVGESALLGPRDEALCRTGDDTDSKRIKHAEVRNATGWQLAQRQIEVVGFDVVRQGEQMVVGIVFTQGRIQLVAAILAELIEFEFARWHAVLFFESTREI